MSMPWRFSSKGVAPGGWRVIERANGAHLGTVNKPSGSPPWVVTHDPDCIGCVGRMFATRDDAARFLWLNTGVLS